MFKYSLLTKTGFNYDFDTFFPEEGEDTEYFHHFRDVFGSENDFIIVGIENKKGVFDTEFLQQVDSLTKVLGKINNIEFHSIPNKYQVYR